MMAATIPAGLYSTNSPDSCQYVTSHSKAKVVILDGHDQLYKYKLIHSNLPDLKAIVVWGNFDQSTLESQGFNVPIFTWNEFLKLGLTISDESIQSRIHYLKPGHCATLIYTSGTTGPPKGVMLSYDNIAWTCRVFANNIVEGGVTTGRIVSYLPLSHIAAQMIDIQFPLYSGTCTYFAQPDALKGTLTVTLKEVQPTVFFAVPRVWEKIQEKLLEIAQKTTGIKKTISTWAKSRGTVHCNNIQYDSNNKGYLPWGYRLANYFILRKIKEALGFNCCLGYYTAAAPISRDTLDYFASLDIPILELFGQTECTGPHSSSKLNAWKIGYCGRSLPGTKTKIDHETGELRYTGRHIFMGYIYMPELTEQSFDSEGYLKSGDIATIDNDIDPNIPDSSGFIKITGRIKDLIITSGGENIPPLLIEEMIVQNIPIVSNCILIGDKRKFLTCLITIKLLINPETSEPIQQLTNNDNNDNSNNNVLPYLLHPSVVSICQHETGNDNIKTLNQLINDNTIKTYIDNKIEYINNNLVTSRAHKIQKWSIIPSELSEKNNELTPTLKLKRNIIIQKYNYLIEQMYAE